MSIFCFLRSPKWNPSQRHRQHQWGPGTSEHGTGLLSLPGDLDRVIYPQVLTTYLCTSGFIYFCAVCSFYNLMPLLGLCLLDGVSSSESQIGKPHLSFVNKGKYSTSHSFTFVSFKLSRCLDAWSFHCKLSSLTLFIRSKFWLTFVLFLAGGRGDSESGDMDSRRIVRYPDSHQLFVGNLPHDIDESELKEFFMSKLTRFS